MLSLIGRLSISGTAITSFGLTAALALAAWLSARKLREEPGSYQIVLEGAVSAMEDAIESVLPGKCEMLFPFIATLWIFILFANLTGIVPGLHSPTSDISVTASLAVLVFLSVHWFGIRADGFANYFKHYLRPSPILLPFHLISEVSRTLALAVRLFGNVMSLEIGYALILLVAGFLVPIPLLMLHLVEAVIQAYLFGTLALIYIAGGIQAQELRKEKERGAL
ncbi:MAG TPA: F0F1 ATP synthase subunit A [Candidatus Acidoferrales bacterium]|jgi:F-type H+-transporting ATPase subunit a|nr:F0F1 ATP synthase subunit A [Candidatus Acidoferrales bacterium]